MTGMGQAAHFRSWPKRVVRRNGGTQDETPARGPRSGLVCHHEDVIPRSGSRSSARARLLPAGLSAAPIAALLVVLVAVAAWSGARVSGTPRAGAAVDVEAALKATVPDLPQRLGRFKRVEMPFDARGLSLRERRLVEALVEASRQLESLYWRQSDPDGLALLQALQGARSATADELRRYLVINGSRWDLVDENRPFVGGMPMPPGHALYPPNLTREEIEHYLAAHPEKRREIFDPYTLVRRKGSDLVGAPYHEAFKPFVAAAAAALRRAAALSDDRAFVRFLRLRAAALSTDDYFASDLAWLELEHPKIDLIFAPYETYLDDLLGVKTSYGAAVLVRNEEESRTLAIYERWVPDIQEALPLAPADRPSVRGHLTPMEVMDAPFRAGDLRHGYQAVADNLPNDPRIHQEKGTKKIFFKNFMDARVREVILPLAARLMAPEQARRVSAGGYLATTVMHEISHGLGPAFARQQGRQVDIREAIGGAYSALEEAKADVVGMFALGWLVDRGVLPRSRLDEYYASYVAGILRTVRFGAGEAHGRAEMMEFNDLSEQGAITASGGRYAVDAAKMPGAIDRLARELLEQEAAGDRARAEAWFARYGAMPPALRRALDLAADVPVDIDPVFAFAERFR